MNIKQPENSQQAESLDLSVRVTIDEEGQKKATEVLWVVLARFLVIAQQFLTTWPGVYYQVCLNLLKKKKTDERGWSAQDRE